MILSNCWINILILNQYVIQGSKERRNTLVFLTQAGQTIQFMHKQDVWTQRNMQGQNWERYIQNI